MLSPSMLCAQLTQKLIKVQYSENLDRKQEQAVLPIAAMVAIEPAHGISAAGCIAAQISAAETRTQKPGGSDPREEQVCGRS